MKGILLFGHGARNPDWARPFQRIEAALRQRAPGVPVSCGYLELLRPSFDEAAATLAAAGVTEIVVVPVFMAAGSHVNKDLPHMAGQAMDRHPGLAIRLAPPVGESDIVLGAMADFALVQAG